MMMPRHGQNPNHAGYVGPRDAYDCTACITAYSERLKFPMLAAVNGDAWALYLSVQDQVRAGMDVIGLDYGVLPAVFDLKGIPQDARPTLFDKITVINQAMIAHRADQREAEERKRALQQGHRG